MDDNQRFLGEEGFEHMVEAHRITAPTDGHNPRTIWSSLPAQLSTSL